MMRSKNNGAWIYIGVDVHDISRCKIGMTTRADINKRFTETANPYYILYNSYDLSSGELEEGELYKFEQYLQKNIGSRISFYRNGRDSEWVDVDPTEADRMILHYIANNIQGINLLNEDIEYNPFILSKIRYENRPLPWTVPEHHDGRHKPYMSLLEQYHNLHHSQVNAGNSYFDPSQDEWMNRFSTEKEWEIYNRFLSQDRVSEYRLGKVE